MTALRVGMLKTTVMVATTIPEETITCEIG